MRHLTSTEIAGRIEDLYGAPFADVTAHAQGQPPGMLSDLLGMHDDLALAEGSIDFHRDHLARLIQPEGHKGRHEVSHLAFVVWLGRDHESVSAVGGLRDRSPSRPPNMTWAPWGRTPSRW
ncbi:hypothetical protein [Streptomyces sp. JV178]|uniref:hypothetical protein n=1 Tax=Streptomyces sp. JV178 TaxID=858632 RepID=UPI000C1B537E|nr:hypothetical protein [Streptomyces sp. JV178]